MAVARARLLAMTDNEDGPPDSPRDDSASLLRVADVRLDKNVMGIINAENDLADKDFNCLNLLRSVPTPRLQALAHRANLPENKPDPQSQFLLRDIHWETERRKRWRHRETLKDRTEQQRNGLYKMKIVPVIHVDAGRKVVHLSGRQVVGKRSRPLLQELNAWKQSEIAASRAREAAEIAAEVARQAEFEEAKRELDEEIEEMKRRAKLNVLNDGAGVATNKRKKKRRKKKTILIVEDPVLEESLVEKIIDIEQDHHANKHNHAKEAAQERLRSNAIVIPRTPDDTKLRPWFSYVKGLKTETMRQSGLLRPTEHQLQETLEMSHKLEEENKNYRIRIKHLNHELAVQTSENKTVTKQANIVREKSGIRIREMDSTIVRVTKQFEQSESKGKADVIQLKSEMDAFKAKSKQKVLELTAELLGIKREAKGATGEIDILQISLKQQQDRAEISSKKNENLERLLKESKKLCEKTQIKLNERDVTVLDMNKVSIVQLDEIKQLKQLLQDKSKELKAATKKSALKERDLNRRIKDLISNNQKKLIEQTQKFERDNHLMRAKVNHVELVLDDADKRAVASDKAVRKQLNTERAERGDRERNHDNQLKLAQERIIELKRSAEISENERLAIMERSDTLEEELRQQIVSLNKDTDQKMELSNAHLEQVRREKDEIIDSKERQLRTVRGKLTVVKARINDMNSMQIEQKQADDNELLRLQAWVKTLEQRLGDAENAREQESNTLRKLAKDREILAEEARNSAKIQVSALARETAKIREQLTAADSRLEERSKELFQAAQEAEEEKKKLVDENDNASTRASELITTFKEQELQWGRNDRALRRKIEQLENEKSDALKLKNMHEVDDELMKAKTTNADLRAEMQTVELNASKDRNDRTAAVQELILLKDKYKADMAERNTVVSRIQRGQEQLEMDAFSAKNSSQVHQTERKNLQEQLDEITFELRQLKKTSSIEEGALKGELELANKSVKALQIQLENFYQDTGSKAL